MTIKKAADGSILVSKALSLGTSASACEGDGRAIPSGDAMFQGLGKVIAPQLVNFFAPFFNALPIDLQKDDVTKKACECAKNKEWDKAVAKWLDVLATDEYNYAALYDLGIANEIFGNYDKAIEYYKKAEVASSHKRNKEAIERVEARKIEVDRLKSYGLAIQPHAFENVSATTVVLRGSSSDRHPLYEQPDKTSKVITRLPGGMSVTVIGTEGDWCKIRTPDGREGYVLREELKFN
jgi:tetratricopeptide (TPR) repeat protein